MNWSDKAWCRIESICEQIVELSFLKELMEGSLEREKFIFYLKQDSLYLAEFGKVLAGIALKLDNAVQREAFLSFAGDTMAVEQALHQIYLKESKPNIKISPSCLLYTSYIHKQLAVASVEETAAAVLPCFWVYKKVGDFILANQKKGENQYQNWIDTYGGEEFAQAVEKAIAICNDLAKNTTVEKQEKMLEACEMATKMEWMFWNSAYQLEKWPIE